MNIVRLITQFRISYAQTHPKVWFSNEKWCKGVSHVKMPLGRWNKHNYTETSLKIKYATEDNCGISHNNKNITQILQNTTLDDDKKYIHMMGYESAHN